MRNLTLTRVAVPMTLIIGLSTACSDASDSAGGGDSGDAARRIEIASLAELHVRIVCDGADRVVRAAEQDDILDLDRDHSLRVRGVTGFGGRERAPSPLHDDDEYRQLHDALQRMGRGYNQLHVAEYTPAVDELRSQCEHLDVTPLTSSPDDAHRADAELACILADSHVISMAARADGDPRGLVRNVVLGSYFAGAAAWDDARFENLDETASDTANASRRLAHEDVDDGLASWQAHCAELGLTFDVHVGDVTAAAADDRPAVIDVTHSDGWEFQMSLEDPRRVREFKFGLPPAPTGTTYLEYTLVFLNDSDTTRTYVDDIGAQPWDTHVEIFAVPTAAVAQAAVLMGLEIECVTVSLDHCLLSGYWDITTELPPGRSEVTGAVGLALPDDFDDDQITVCFATHTGGRVDELAGCAAYTGGPPSVDGEAAVARMMGFIHVLGFPPWGVAATPDAFD